MSDLDKSLNDLCSLLREIAVDNQGKVREIFTDPFAQELAKNPDTCLYPTQLLNPFGPLDTELMPCPMCGGLIVPGDWHLRPNRAPTEEELAAKAAIPASNFVLDL